MKSVLVNFGDAVRVLQNDEEILRLVFGVDTNSETIEVITISRLENDIEVMKVFADE